MSSNADQDVRAFSYGNVFLALYDWIVLGFNMPFAWCCSLNTLVRFYGSNMSSNHLDVGVATGYFPATILQSDYEAGRRLPAKQHITLSDLQDAPMRLSESRIHREAPGTDVRCIQADATAPLPPAFGAQTFDSISMFNLLHCIPAPGKLRVFEVFRDVLSDDGVLYGCTVLGEQYVQRWWVKWWWLPLHHRMGAFHCQSDTKDMFEDELRKQFGDVETSMIGQVLLFKASRPIRG